MAELDGKRALITGSGRGMGRAHALSMARHGAEIIVQDIDGTAAAETSALIEQQGGTARVLVADVADTGAIQACLVDLPGGVDILVNNAGIVSPGTFEEIDEASFDRMFDVHVKGSFFAAQAVVPGMKAKGGGKIINISSIWGMVGHETHSHYCAAKAALLGFTKAWAKELAPHRILVNAVAPGGVITEMALADGGMARIEEKARTRVPLGRYAAPEEIAETVLFLASPRSDFITGQVISPNGGETIVGI